MTLLRWREHPEAREELLNALDWYDEQEVGLGDRLLSEVNAAVRFVRKWPEAAPRYSRRDIPRLRRKNVDVFPYGIVYFVRDAEVIVVAYAHEKRRPGYWRKRLENL